jgi:hypothetical protein
MATSRLTEQLLKRFGHADPSVTRDHYIKQLETEPPHSRGKVLDFRLTNYLKVVGVRERKRASDTAASRSR